MNLWFRLIWVLIAARFRRALALPQDASILRFRVWPFDLDPAIHMNNGRYLTLMDLGRLDIVVRSGLWRAVLKNGWTPVASTVTIRFSRELPPFQSFRLETRIACWDDKLVVMEQTFLIDGGARDGQIAARALFKGGIYDRKALAFVPMARLMETIGVSGESPLPSAEIEAFLRADAEIKQSQRALKSVA